jgi:hypothetical protein
MRELGVISSQAEIAPSARLVWNTTAQRKTGYLNFLQNVLVSIIITKKYIHMIYYLKKILGILSFFFSSFFFDSRRVAPYRPLLAGRPWV